LVSNSTDTRQNTMIILTHLCVKESEGYTDRSQERRRVIGSDVHNTMSTMSKTCWRLEPRQVDAAACGMADKRGAGERWK